MVWFSCKPCCTSSSKHHCSCCASSSELFGGIVEWSPVESVNSGREEKLKQSPSLGAAPPTFQTHKYPTPLGDTGTSEKSTASPRSVATPKLSPEQKVAEKARVKDQVKNFIEHASKGIDVTLLKIDEWRYVSAKFFLRWARKEISVESDDYHHECLISEVQGVYNFWEGCVLWQDAHLCIAPSDRNRAIIICCNVKYGPSFTCLLESDATSQEVLVSSMNILRNLHMQR